MKSLVSRVLVNTEYGFSLQGMLMPYKFFPGLPENVEKAKEEIEAHIAARTGSQHRDVDDDFASNGTLVGSPANCLVQEYVHLCNLIQEHFYILLYMVYTLCVVISLIVYYFLFK